ncbi:hypothetical protein ACWITZ_09250, partial [Ursidibacter sp. B-7004-1]
SGDVNSPNGTIDVDATNNFTNTETGNLKAKEDVTVDAKNIDNDGNVTSENGTVHLNATENLDNSGNITGDKGVDLDGKDITNSGNVNSPNGTIDVNAENKFTNTETGNLSGKDVTINSPVIDNRGTICKNGVCDPSSKETSENVPTPPSLPLKPPVPEAKDEVVMLDVGSLVGKDTLLDQLDDSLKVVTESVREDIGRLEKSKSELDGLASIISDAAVCSVELPAGVSRANQEIVRSCEGINSKSSRQYKRFEEEKKQ